VDAEERAEMLAAQVEEQAMQLPDLEEALRQAQAARRAAQQRGAGAAADWRAGRRAAQF
jgi:chromosome segregation protein